MSPKRQAGFSLAETMVYIGLLAVMGTVLVSFASRVIKQNAHVQLTAITLASARGAIDTIAKETRHASGIYTPTSIFGTHPGQLSLATTENLPADEEITYVDFYLDDERLYRKREGQNPELLTSEQLKATNLTFTHLHTSASSTTVQIQLTVAPANASSEATAQASVTLTASATPRTF